MKDFHIDGIVPIIPTPFFEDDTPDWESLRGLIGFAHSTGASAVCLPAYASEFYKLSEEERRTAIAKAVELSAGRIPVIAQVNFASPRLVVEAALSAGKSGATAISTAVPRMMALSEKDLFRHFAHILQSVDLPFLIQDFNPGGHTVSTRIVADLHRAFPHFRYLKYCWSYAWAGSLRCAGPGFPASQSRPATRGIRHVHACIAANCLQPAEYGVVPSR